ncbi:MAG: malonate decarboxylase subunit alpha [Endomicrobia bacterium]|nr:malonate decarboxylase subunit alpha [Endomicrobiia bacterium]MDW8055954.1 malonate decarboxylase subunit alpha [Elusimicrobiota bacterium]
MNYREYTKRVKVAKKLCCRNSKIVSKDNVIQLLETVIRSGDRVCLEGDNQKQADFLARKLLQVNPKKINNLHLVQSSIVLSEHIGLIKKGIVSKIDFAYSGPQAKAIAELIKSKNVTLGAIHTYIELFSRYFLDLTPSVSLVVADASDKEGNLYLGYNSEDTPTIVAATKSKSGIVIAQVSKLKKVLPRVDISKDFVDFIVVTDEPYYIQPLFTRDPAKITEQQILMAAMVIKGIYLPYKVVSLNHGIGFATAAIELILPTYGEKLGIKGKYVTHWVLNPHPTLIPAIENGFVKHIYCFGSEPGMEEYIKHRSDVFSTGPDRVLMSNRLYAHLAGLYGIDLFIGSTLQMDQFGNSSTVTFDRIPGFGGAPNLGSTPPGRRHITESFSLCKREDNLLSKFNLGSKLVVQITPTLSPKGTPVFVEELDAVKFYKQKILPYIPVMIYWDQITHIVTEKGIAYLHKCKDIKTRMLAISAVAGDTPVGRKITRLQINKLRMGKIVAYPEDLGIDIKKISRNLLSAKSFDDLIKWSYGLYYVPKTISEG